MPDDRHPLADLRERLAEAERKCSKAFDEAVEQERHIATERVVHEETRRELERWMPLRGTVGLSAFEVDAAEAKRAGDIDEIIRVAWTRGWGRRTQGWDEISEKADEAEAERERIADAIEILRLVRTINGYRLGEDSCPDYVDEWTGSVPLGTHDDDVCESCSIARRIAALLDARESK